MTRPIVAGIPPATVVTPEPPVLALPPLATGQQYTDLTGQPAPPGLLGQASAAVRRYCGWHISPVIDEQLIVDGSGGRALGLPTLRLLDVLSVYEPGAVVVSNPPLPEEQVSLADLDWSVSGWLSRVTPWTDRERGVWVTARHGFEPVEVPDLAAVVCIVAARAAANPQGANAVTIGGVSVQFPTDPSGSGGGLTLSGGQLTILESYRLFED